MQQCRIDMAMDMALAGRRHLEWLSGRRNAGHACEENKLALRDLITASPYAGAIYVLEGNRLLCTTLHRPIPVQNLPDYLFGKQDLILASHSPITGQTAILYRQQLGKRTLLAELDGFHIFGALRATKGEKKLFFILGARVLDDHGKTLPAATLQQDERKLLSSPPDVHPYRLVALNGYPQILAFAWDYNRDTLLAAPCWRCCWGCSASISAAGVVRRTASWPEPSRYGSSSPICNRS